MNCPHCGAGVALDFRCDLLFECRTKWNKHDGKTVERGDACYERQITSLQTALEAAEVVLLQCPPSREEWMSQPAFERHKCEYDKALALIQSTKPK